MPPNQMGEALQPSALRIHCLMLLATMRISRIVAILGFVIPLAQRVSGYTPFIQVVATNIEDSPIRVTVTEERGYKLYKVFVIPDSWHEGWTNVTFSAWLDGQWLPPRFPTTRQQEPTALPKPGKSPPTGQAMFDFVVPTAKMFGKRFKVFVYGDAHGQPENMRIPYLAWWFYLNDFADVG